jgi:hypothetical protein
MKKKYGTRLMAYLTQDVIVVVLFVFAIICGSMYALSMKDKNSTVFLMLNNYMLSDSEMTFKMERFIAGLYSYLKQLAVVWVLGFFSFTLPLSMAALFVMAFSYAFTTTCTIMVYGVKGLVAALVVYGVQAVIILGTALYLEIASLRLYTLKTTQLLNNQVFNIIPIIGSSCLVSLLDGWTASYGHTLAGMLL